MTISTTLPDMPQRSAYPASHDFGTRGHYYGLAKEAIGRFGSTHQMSEEYSYTSYPMSSFRYEVVETYVDLHYTTSLDLDGIPPKVCEAAQYVIKAYEVRYGQDDDQEMDVTFTIRIVYDRASYNRTDIVATVGKSSVELLEHRHRDPSDTSDNPPHYETDLTPGEIHAINELRQRLLEAIIKDHLKHHAGLANA